MCPIYLITPFLGLRFQLTVRPALLLLAAGASSRMGTPKQLLPYHGRTLLRHAAETAAATGCAPLILVTGAEHEALLPEVAGLPFQAVHNPRWAAGMGTSIRVGLAAVEAAGTARGALIMLADQPLVTVAFLQQLIVAHRQATHPIVAAGYPDGMAGVPAVFAAEVFPALRTLAGSAGAGP